MCSSGHFLYMINVLDPRNLFLTIFNTYSGGTDLFFSVLGPDIIPIYFK
jgi:hypothetical protein